MRNILALCAALLCSGCAFTTATIDIPYQSITAPAPVAGAAGVTIQVVVTDGRTTHQDRVGSKRNGYGMETAPILSSNDLPSTIQSAFAQELTARGFKLGANSATLNVQLVQFYNDFEAGMFSGTATATVAFNTSITAPGNHIVFSRYYAGTGVDPDIQLADGSNAQVALVKAFQDAVASAINDPAFINGLIAAGAVAPGT